MIHSYYGIYDKVAKCFAWVGENKNNNTFARMCNVMQKDKNTFIGRVPGDLVVQAMRPRPRQEPRFNFCYLAHALFVFHGVTIA